MPTNHMLWLCRARSALQKVHCKCWSLQTFAERASAKSKHEVGLVCKPLQCEWALVPPENSWPHLQSIAPWSLSYIATVWHDPVFFFKNVYACNSCATSYIWQIELKYSVDKPYLSLCKNRLRVEPTPLQKKILPTGTWWLVLTGLQYRFYSAVYYTETLRTPFFWVILSCACCCRMI